MDEERSRNQHNQPVQSGKSYPAAEPDCIKIDLCGKEEVDLFSYFSLCAEEIENNKVEKTPEKELPLLLESLKWNSSKSILSKRLKGER